MIELAGILGLAMPWAIGVFLVRAIWPVANGGIRQLAFRLGLGFGVGCGVVSLLVFGSLFWFGQLDQRTSLVEVGVLVLLAIVCLLRRKPSAPLEVPERGTPIAPAQAPLLLVAAGVVVVTLICAMTLARANPHGGWDAWAIWNVRAKFLLLGGDAWRIGFSDLVDAGHPDYPLLLAGSVAQAWNWAGGATPKLSGMVGLLFVGSVVAAVFGAVGCLRGRAVGLLAALAWCGSATAIGNLHQQYADIPLSLFMLATLALTVMATSGRARHDLLLLAGICAGCAAWTKNEGALFTGAFLVLHALRTWWASGLGGAVKRTSVLLLGAVPFLAVLVFFKVTMSPHNVLVGQTTAAGLRERLVDLERWRTVGRAFRAELLHFHERTYSEPDTALPLVKDTLALQPGQGAPWWVAVGLLPILAVAALVAVLLARRHERAQVVLPLACVVGMLCAYYVIYVLTPLPLEWHLSASLPRLILGLWPGMLLALLLCFRGADAAAPGAPEPE